MKVVCMIPVYREYDNCRLIIPELQSVLVGLDIDYHIVLVIAGDDGTREYVTELWDVRVAYIYEWDHPTWLGNAYNIGYKKALTYNPDVVVSLDGDGNHDPALLADMFAAIVDGYDIVVGSRYIAGWWYASDVYLPLYKVVLSRWINIVLSWILWLSVVDKSSGYRCVRTSFVAKIVNERHPIWFSHQVYLLWLWSFLGAKIVEIPQRHRPRKYGVSKFPIWGTLWWYAMLCWTIFIRKFLGK